MSSIQRLEQMPVCRKAVDLSVLYKDLQETAKVFALALVVSVTVSEEAAVEVDHGLFLTVAENLIGNAARFAQRRLEIVLEAVWEKDERRLLLTVQDDGAGYPAALLKDGPKPFGKKHEDPAHFGMGLYSSQLICTKHGGALFLENKADGGAVAKAIFS